MSPQVTDSALALIDDVMSMHGLRFDEAKGSYYYETENVKRWVLGDGGATGNCEVCEGNADMDWILDDETFEDTEGGDIDGPPAHPHDTCDLEYSERRHRVYV